MALEESKPEWFEAFKKVNAPTHDAAGTPPPGRPERRGHARFALHDAAAKLYRRGATSILGLARLNIEGVLLDLSEGGLRLKTSEQFLADTKVRLKITVAKFNDSIEADGVTRWCQGDPKDPEQFQVGIAFVNLDPAVARKIGRMRTWYTSAQYAAILQHELREKAGH